MKQKIKQHNAFTLAEGGHSPLLCGDAGTQGSPRLVNGGFTLAEVLITLGVIGVVAAITMPTLVANIQERVRKEQVRTVKYKLTKATDKMKSLGKIGRYDAPATMNFVNELKKHMTIAKICDSSHLAECWPTDTINTYLNNSTNLSTVSVSDLTKGTGLNALAVSSGGEDTVGIVTGDGVPMLLVYSPVCQSLDEVKTYTWSVEDGKPITNATTNCISAIFDINGAKGPNRVGQDVRTLNSVFGAVEIGVPNPVSKEECQKTKNKYGVRGCYYSSDYWFGSVKTCAEIGLHLPDMMTLANLGNAKYGTTKIGAYTLYLGDNHEASSYPGGCRQYVIDKWDNGDTGRVDASDAILCGEKTDFTDPQAGYTVKEQNYWSNFEFSGDIAYSRNFMLDRSRWAWKSNRSSSVTFALCVGD